jgi:hypothetical protein
MKTNTRFGALVAAILLGAVASMGCHSPGSRHERSTGQYIDDKGLAKDVRSALKNNPVYKLDEVNVSAFRGTVQLSGFVSIEDQQRRAGEIASDVPGVQNVENNISLTPGPLRQQELSRQEAAEREWRERQTDRADRAEDDPVADE